MTDTTPVPARRGADITLSWHEFVVALLVVAAVSLACGAYLGRMILCERMVAAPVMQEERYVRPALYCEVPATWSW